MVAAAGSLPLITNPQESFNLSKSNSKREEIYAKGMTRKEYYKQYRQRPENKTRKAAYMRDYRQRPDVIAKQSWKKHKWNNYSYRKTNDSEFMRKKRDYQREYQSRPEQQTEEKKRKKIDAVKKFYERNHDRLKAWHRDYAHVRNKEMRVKAILIYASCCQWPGCNNPIEHFHHVDGNPSKEKSDRVYIKIVSHGKILPEYAALCSAHHLATHAIWGYRQGNNVEHVHPTLDDYF